MPISRRRVMSELPEGNLTLKAKVVKCIFHNDKNGYTVLAVRNRDIGDAIIAYNTPMPALDGDAIIAEGAWGEYKGKTQFKATVLRTEVDLSDSGLVAWLKNQKLPGIGPRTILRLSTLFRGRMADVIGTAEAMSVAIGLPKARIIAKAYSENSQRANYVAEMMKLGFTAKQVIAIDEEYGDTGLTVARTDPWDISRRIDGIGFPTCDHIAERAGMDMRCEARLIGGLKWVLGDKLVQNGHCGVPEEYLRHHTARLLEVPRENVDSIYARFLAATPSVVFDAFSGLVYPVPVLEAEKTIANRLLRLVERGHGAAPSVAMATEAIHAAEAALGMTLDREGGQFEAALAALTEGVLVITGGPGTGKSTIQQIVVRALESLGKSVMLAAPTGRAAKRLSDTSGKEAVTIHRLLEFNPESGQFNRNETRPLKTDVVIVDEFSMTDVRIGASLLRAVALGTSFIMVGDYDQLPSVGPGQVLRDIITSDAVPVTRLTKVRRQATGSGIALAAARVREGLSPWEGEGEMPDDFRVVTASESSMAEIILNLVSDMEADNYRPREDVQVLASMRKGDAGVENLNLLLKDRLNPVVPHDGRSVRMGYRWFTVGDRVMQIRNDYNKGVYNGEVGEVSSVEQAEDGKPLLRVNFGTMTAAYKTSEEADDVVLAYAATVHKSQGCEFPVVIVACPEAHRRMLSRNLIYTAMTRARTRCILVGSRSVIARAAATEDAFSRFTALEKRLRELAA